MLNACLVWFCNNGNLRVHSYWIRVKFVYEDYWVKVKVKVTAEKNARNSIFRQSKTSIGNNSG